MIMKHYLIISLAAVSILFTSSCGTDVLKSVSGSKKDTKVQFYNESWAADGSTWTAELRIMETRLRAHTNSWSNVEVLNDCKHDTARTATLFDQIWPVYVFTNVPLECEKNNLYIIRVLGFHHYIEWRTGDLQ